MHYEHLILGLKSRKAVVRFQIRSGLFFLSPKEPSICLRISCDMARSSRVRSALSSSCHLGPIPFQTKYI